MNENCPGSRATKCLTLSLRRLYLVFGVFVFAAALPFAPGAMAQRPSFDCARAANDVERAICRNPDLARLDSEMAGAFSAAVAHTSNLGELRAQQRAWLRQRNACPTLDCVANAFTARIAELRQDPATSVAPASRVWFGVNIQDVPADLARARGLRPDAGGALVTSTRPDGPAAAAGILPGDIILRIRGEDVGEAVNLPRIVATIPRGSAVPVVVWRGGRAQTIQVAPDEMPQELAGAAPSGVDRHGVATRNAEIARREADRQASEQRDAVRRADLAREQQAARLATERAAQLAQQNAMALARQRFQERMAIIGAGIELSGDITCRDSEQTVTLHTSLQLSQEGSEWRGIFRFAFRDSNDGDLLHFGAARLVGALAARASADGSLRLDPEAWILRIDARLPTAANPNLETLRVDGVLMVEGPVTFTGTLFAGPLRPGLVCPATMLRESRSPWQAGLADQQASITTLVERIPALATAPDDAAVVVARTSGGRAAQVQPGGSISFPDGLASVCLVDDLFPDADFRALVLQRIADATRARVQRSCAGDTWNVLVLRRYALPVLTRQSLASLARIAATYVFQLTVTVEEHDRQIAQRREAAEARAAEARSVVVRRLAVERNWLSGLLSAAALGDEERTAAPLVQRSIASQTQRDVDEICMLPDTTGAEAFRQTARMVRRIGEVLRLYQIVAETRHDLATRQAAYRLLEDGYFPPGQAALSFAGCLRLVVQESESRLLLLTYDAAGEPSLNLALPGREAGLTHVRVVGWGSGGVPWAAHDSLVGITGQARLYCQSSAVIDRDRRWFQSLVLPLEESRFTTAANNRFPAWSPAEIDRLHRDYGSVGPIELNCNLNMESVQAFPQGVDRAGAQAAEERVRRERVDRDRARAEAQARSVSVVITCENEGGQQIGLMHCLYSGSASGSQGSIVLFDGGEAQSFGPRSFSGDTTVLERQLSPQWQVRAQAVSYLPGSRLMVRVRRQDGREFTQRTQGIRPMTVTEGNLR